MKQHKFPAEERGTKDIGWLKSKFCFSFSDFTDPTKSAFGTFIRPRYQLRHFPLGNRKNKLQTIISSEEGQAHCWINQNAKLSLGHFDKGSRIPYAFNPVNKCLYLFVMEGSVEVGDVRLLERDAIGLWDTDRIEVNCLSDAQFLLIETPINQK